MDTKIFLQGFNSKKSSNTSEGLNVELRGKKKLLPFNDVADVISQYDQYKEEREACNIIRLTCEVNPICSNVLFNRISEIVKNEGSSGVTFINYGVHGYDESGESYENKESELFNGVVYKPNIVPSCWPNCPKPMEFWSCGTMKYESVDNPIAELPSTAHIETAVGKNRNTIYTNLTCSVTHPTNSIRDTQLSNTTTKFIYHCGLDIFNNHLIRSNTFKTVCKLGFGTATSYDDCPYCYYQGFNTIADKMRDVNGNRVVEKVSYPTTAGVQNNAKLISLHLYQYDDIYSFNECVENRLIKKYNGWLGFENKSKIKSYLNFSKGKDTEMTIERPIMYMNGGDFVDMYPSRDLYSFVPKYNNFKKRIEKNWNYCITYPSSSYTPSTSADPFSDIIEYNDNINSLKVVYFDENTRSDNGTTQLVMYGIAKHGLSKGDYVNVYKTRTSQNFWLVDENGDIASKYFSTKEEAQLAFDTILTHELSPQQIECYNYNGQRISGISSDTSVTINEKIFDNAEVKDIVDDYIFTLTNSNIRISDEWHYLSDSELDNNKFEISVKTDCGEEYIKEYVGDVSKKFFTCEGKKYYLVNGRYVNIDDDTLNISYKKVVGDIECDYYIRVFSKLPNFKFASGDTSNEYELYKNDEEVIHTYQDRKYDFENHLSRLAFSKNVYSDDIGEIVFTDDIDISNLHDNLGRPLTSLYLTIIKNNHGYKEWYGFDYSSTTRWDVSQISADTVEYSHAFGRVTCGIETSLESSYSDGVNSIYKINNVNGSSGYSIDNVLRESGNTYEVGGKTISISKNEIWYDIDKQFYGDLCYYDGYNAVEEHIGYVMHRFSPAQRESVNGASSEYYRRFCFDEILHDDYDTMSSYEIEAKDNGFDCNKKKEGYYYIPHYEIPIKTFDKLESMMPDFLKIRQIVNHNDGSYTITTSQNHYLTIGDKATIYDSENEKYYNLVTISGGTDDDYKVFTCLAYEDSTNNLMLELKNDDRIHYRLFKMDNLDCPSYARVLKDGTCRVVWRNIINNGFNESDDSVEEYPFTNGAFYVNKRVDMFVRRQDPYGDYLLVDVNDEYEVEGEALDMITEDNYVKDNDIEC